MCNSVAFTSLYMSHIYYDAHMAWLSVLFDLLVSASVSVFIFVSLALLFLILLLLLFGNFHLDLRYWQTSDFLSLIRSMAFTIWFSHMPLFHFAASFDIDNDNKQTKKKKQQTHHNNNKHKQKQSI